MLSMGQRPAVVLDIEANKASTIIKLGKVERVEDSKAWEKGQRRRGGSNSNKEMKIGRKRAEDSKNSKKILRCMVH